MRSLDQECEGLSLISFFNPRLPVNHNGHSYRSNSGSKVYTIGRKEV
jgi:hypothetical protein